MNYRVVTVLAVTAALGVGIYAGTLLAKPEPQWDYTEVRADFVRTNAALSGPVDFVALGDSVTESVNLEGVCGRAFNAGVGGAMASDVAAMSRAILPRLHPSAILVAVGANHFWQGDDGLPAFERDYTALLDTLPPARVALMGVPNSERASAWIEQEARRRGFAYIPPVRGQGLTRWEGVHLTVAGAREWRRRVESHCTTDLSSNGSRSSES